MDPPALVATIVVGVVSAIVGYLARVIQVRFIDEPAARRQRREVAQEKAVEELLDLVHDA